jgi:hypothetical protein
MSPRESDDRKWFNVPGACFDVLRQHGLVDIVIYEHTSGGTEHMDVRGELGTAHIVRR